MSLWEGVEALSCAAAAAKSVDNLNCERAAAV